MRKENGRKKNVRGLVRRGEDASGGGGREREREREEEAGKAGIRTLDLLLHMDCSVF